MAAFRDLNEIDRIQIVKDNFVSILEELVIDPTKIQNYIDIREPKLKAFIPKDINPDQYSDDMKNNIIKQNAEAKDKIDKDNEKLINDFAARKVQAEKAALAISKIVKKTGCSCGTCFDVDFINSNISQELEIFIDYARKEAEAKNY